jgi:predicted tellurium resistance membrane protein TerC
VAVWLGGPSRSAVDARRGLAPYLARPGIAYGALAALFLLLLLWQPVVQTTRPQLMLGAAVLLVIALELLRRQTAAETSAPEPDDRAESAP